MGWKTLDDMDLNGKRVLVRVDINVPVVDGGVHAPDVPGLGVRPDPDALGAPVATYE